MSQQQRQRDIWNQPQIMKKIFNHTDIHIISNGGTYHNCVWNTRINSHDHSKPPAQFLYNLSLSIGFVLAQFLVLFIFSRCINLILLKS